MYHSFLIHSSADGHLCCFHVLAIINSVSFSFSYKAVSYHASGHNVAYRPGGFKASTGFESSTRNKKIYDGGARTEDEGQSHPSKYDYV